MKKNNKPYGTLRTLEWALMSEGSISGQSATVTPSTSCSYVFLNTASQTTKIFFQTSLSVYEPEERIYSSLIRSGGYIFPIFPYFGIFNLLQTGFKK